MTTKPTRRLKILTTYPSGVMEAAPLADFPQLPFTLESGVDCYFVLSSDEVDSHREVLGIDWGKLRFTPDSYNTEDYLEGRVTYSPKTGPPEMVESVPERERIRCARVDSARSRSSTSSGKPTSARRDLGVDSRQGGLVMDMSKTYANNKIHNGWESVYRKDPLQGHFNELIMDRVIELLDPAPDALFLDAGCGSGGHTLRIAQRGFRCVGADISGYVLKKAEEKIAAMGLQAKASVSLQNLEDMSFEDRTFDFVHCRGVLMHIPDWERALGQLCRVLKPGGKIVLFEGNQKSLETLVVRLVRRFRKGVSRMVETPGGLEFWGEKDGNPIVVRVADIRYLTHFLESRNFKDVHNIATEFWDINRFPGGVVRNGIIRFNRLWFSLGLPALPSVGNAVVAEKT